ncbi:hypothetical protein LDENG_00218620 [Lucifuga dentata]|nr:hypothetical protein LDENG_00218620 [Lucifuga dentata]
MDLRLQDALGGGGGRVPAGAPGEGLLQRDFVAALDKDSYDDKVGETVTKSDYRPLLDGKDPKSGPGMTSSVMSTGGRHDQSGQPAAFSSDFLSGFSQSGMGTMSLGSGLPPFQTSMSSTLGQPGLGSAMDTQKSSGLFGSEPKTTSNTSGSSPFKASDPFSFGGPGIHSVDNSAAPILSPSGSMDDSSPASSTSEPLSPERVGPGGEAGKQQQRRRKKKRKGRDEVYEFLDNQEAESNKHGMISPASSQEKGGGEEEEEEEEEENWEWEIRESGGGGRVKGRKSKGRARLPEEWGAPQQPVSPTPATVAPSWATAADPKSYESKAPNCNPKPDLPSAPSKIPTGFTSQSHAGLLTELPPRSYEPMCIDTFPVSSKDMKTTNDANPVGAVAATTGATPTASTTNSATPPTYSVATPFTSTATPPPSITPAAPPSLPAHSEHQDSSPPQLPQLEGW